MFKKANINHLDEIISIENNIFNQPWSKVHFVKDLQLEISFNIVCIEGENCIGYLFGYFIEDEYHLNNIAIKKSYQRRGFAKKMLNYIIEKCKDQQINKIMLEVRCDNIPAIKLYDSMGFYKINVRKNYYKKGKDAFLYNLDIN